MIPPNDVTGWPIHPGARVRVVPPYNEKLRIFPPTYLGDVTGFEDDGAVVVMTDRDGFKRRARPADCVVRRRTARTVPYTRVE